MRTGRPNKYEVALSEEERKELESLTNRGKHKTRVITRARILLLLNEGKLHKEIISVLKISAPTIWKIAKRYCEEGLSSALEEKPRPGAKPKLDAKGEAHLIALACSEAPDERESWTMQLLAEQIIELGIVDEISDETVRRTLKKKT